jgi:hypothetical protein
MRVFALAGPTALALFCCDPGDFAGDLVIDSGAPGAPETGADVLAATPDSSPDASDAGSSACPSTQPAAPGGSAYWAKLAGLPTHKNDDQHASGLAVDPAGNSVVIGYFSGSIDLGGDRLVSDDAFPFDDVYVAKHDANGNHVWSQRFGSPGQHFGEAVTTDSAGNVYLSGSFSGAINFSDDPKSVLTTNPGAIFNMFVAKLAPNGTHVWSKSFGGDAANHGVQGFAIDVDPEGSILVSGVYNGQVDLAGPSGPGPGPGHYVGSAATNAFMMKLTASGDYVWSRAFGGEEGKFSFVWDQAVDSRGSAVIVGDFNGAMDLGDGKSLVSYGCTSGIICNANAFVIKVDTNGGLVFSRTLGGSGSSSAEGVALDARGDIALSGIFQGDLDVAKVVGTGTQDASTGWSGFVAKIDGTTGADEWGYGLPYVDGSALQHIAADLSGNVYTASTFAATLAIPGAPSPLTSVGGSDVSVSKLDSDGKYVWSRRYGGLLYDELTGIAVDACGSALVVSGTLRSVVTFENADGGLLTLDGTIGTQDAGGNDLFFARLAP